MDYGFCLCFQIQSIIHNPSGTSDWEQYTFSGLKTNILQNIVQQLTDELILVSMLSIFIVDQVEVAKGSLFLGDSSFF